MARVGGGRTWVLVVAMAVVANGAGVLGLLRKGLCVLLWRGRPLPARARLFFASPASLSPVGVTEKSIDQLDQWVDCPSNFGRRR